MEGIRAGVNWKLFGAQFASWVVTMFVVGGVTAALFAQGVYTPSKIDGAQVAAYQKGLMQMSKDVSKVQKQLKNWKNVSQPQSTAIKPADVFKTYKAAAGLTANNTVDTLGQTTVYPGAQLCNGPSLEDIQANTRAECKAPTW